MIKYANADSGMEREWEERENKGKSNIPITFYLKTDI